jgi:hypothetical protein
MRRYQIPSTEQFLTAKSAGACARLSASTELACAVRATAIAAPQSRLQRHNRNSQAETRKLELKLGRRNAGKDVYTQGASGQC